MITLFFRVTMRGTSLPSAHLSTISSSALESPGLVALTSGLLFFFFLSSCELVGFAVLVLVRAAI